MEKDMQIEFIYDYKIDDYRNHNKEQDNNGGKYAHFYHVSIFKSGDKFLKLTHKEFSGDFNMYHNAYIKELGCCVTTDINLDNKEEVSIFQIVDEICLDQVIENINVNKIYMDENSTEKMYCSPNTLLKRISNIIV